MNFDEVFKRREANSAKWRRYSEEVIPLWVADMDFQSPECVKEALNKLSDHNIYGYTMPSKSLMHAIVAMLDSRYNWQVKSTSIVWLPGLTPALNIACRAFAPVNGKVLISTPIYPPFQEAPINSEKLVDTVELIKNAGRFEMDYKTIQDKAKDASLYLLCNPHNPVGRVFSEEELKKLADICLQNDVVLCSDEIHCDLILDEGKKHIPLGSISKEIEQNSITLMAPSKTYNIPGLGFSFAVIPNNKLRHQFRKTMKGMVPYPGMAGLAAAEAVYKHGEPWRLKLLDYLRTNRALLERFFTDQEPRIKYITGEATYLAWLDVKELKLENPVQFFIKNGVALTDGAEFGQKGFLRLNFGCTYALLDEALNRIKKACDTI
jgi:cystathionine beta-lyase